MHKSYCIIILLASVIVLIPAAIGIAASIEQMNNCEKPDYTDDAKYPYFYGRLYIESVGIDVALYRDQYNKQRAVDRQDSACYFRLSNGGWLIADHKTQAFGTLVDVVVGDEAKIILQNGDVLYLVCVEVLDGINTGHGITDKKRKIQHGKYDILMYTCLTNWQDIRICQWNFVEH